MDLLLTESDRTGQCEAIGLQFSQILTQDSYERTSDKNMYFELDDLVKKVNKNSTSFRYEERIKNPWEKGETVNF